MSHLYLKISLGTPKSPVVSYQASVLDQLGSRIYVSVPPILSDEFLDVVQPQSHVEIQLDDKPAIAPIVGQVYAVEADGLWIDLPAPFKNLQQQRRDHLRVKVNLPLQVFSEAMEIPDEATCVSLSGGGLRFQSILPYVPGSKLRLCFKLAQGVRQVPVNVMGEVVFQKRLPHARQLFDVGIHFDPLLPRVEDLIVGFCFQQEVHQTKHLQ